jgi:hypothetical protein
MSGMTLPTRLRTALAIVVGAAGLYAMAYAVFGANWFRMSDTDLARVSGCYSVEGHQIFRISGRTLLTSASSIGFAGAHDKDRDVLELDRPVRLAPKPLPHLAEEGTLTKLPIIASKPVRLELWDESDRRVEAIWTACR